MITKLAAGTHRVHIRIKLERLFCFDGTGTFDFEPIERRFQQHADRSFAIADDGRLHR
jgi:hypothetical protein